MTARAARWVVLALALVAYAVRLDAPTWRGERAGPPRYLFDESYTAYTAHRLIAGDASVLEPALRRYAARAAGDADLSVHARGEWSHPPGAPLAIGAAMIALGFDELGARSAAVLAALVALLATAYLAGPQRAWLACLLVAFDGAFFVFARTAMPHMFLVAGLTAGAALLVAAVAATTARERWWLAAFAGGALGFATSVRWTALPIALAAGAAVLASVEGGRRMRGPLLAATGTAAAVYLATYLPWLLHGHDLTDLVQLHRDMLAFHARMPAALGQSAPWYAWPWTRRPTSFLVETAGDSVRAVRCLGSPGLWWAIAPALVLGAWHARHRALACLLPVCAIAGTWLPWALIGRFGMPYYLLPALPFTAQLVGHALRRHRLVSAACAAYALATFALAYPRAAALPVPRAAADHRPRDGQGPLVEHVLGRVRR